MASPDLIDIDSLLQPIPGDAPTGVDAREDPSASSLYQIIKNERNLARAAERQSIHDGDSLQAMQHWERVIEIAPEIIRDQSKDLEVASWYSEAVLRRHGFRGLRDSFRLIQGLIENFWEDLHPMPDEYGIETRVSCISGLNGEGAEGVLIAPIRKVHLTEGRDPGPFSLWQYQQSLDIQKAKDEPARKAKIESLGFDTTDIEKSVAGSSADFYPNIFDDLSESIDLFKTIGVKLDELCGLDDAPPTRTIVTTLDVCLGTIKHIGSLMLPSEEIAEEIENEESENEGGATSSLKAKTKGPIATREDAFKQLIEIADFFRKTEPHSPVSYVLQKAVKWGNMPLAELIGELIPDTSSRERYSELTGVENNEEY